MKEDERLRENGPVGAVLVAGGGIGGIQASLDLANSGYRVYLVEEESAIGGRMAQLDKTFPTNDCSMCTISPKLIEVDKHLNIDIITNAEVESIEGEPGRFTVRVLKRPRFIDLEKCNACGDCIDVCPVSLGSEFDENLMPRKAVYKRYPQAIPNVVAITKGDRAPCGLTCPAGINVQGYTALIAAGKFREAYELILERNPLPSICGRVCHHPCESQCNRKELDEAVAINPLKRFVSDYMRTRGERDDEDSDEPRTAIDPDKPKVAVVGAGPAGLTAARDLALLGYPATVFEALPVAGGMMYTGIPEYRLPKSIIAHDVHAILELEIELRTNISVGRDISLENLRDQGYKAFFLAIGAHVSLRMNIPGEDLRGVHLGTDFLRDHNLGRGVAVGKKMVIVGGGNVAVDAARSCLRIGAEEVRILYRRTREEMPASGEEVEAALEEGVAIDYLAAPVEILGKDGKVRGARCVRMELGEPDASGRRRPIPLEGSGYEVACDGLVMAIGQACDTSLIGDGCAVEMERGAIKVDEVTLETSVHGVFAGGDAATGPKSVVEAIGQGHEAAISIDRYLQGKDLREGRSAEKGEPAPVPEEGSFVSRPRQAIRKIPSRERKGNFSEVEATFTEEEAVAEAERCLNCGICCECFQCVTACQANAVAHDMKPEVVELTVGSVIVTPGFECFDARLKGEYGYGRYRNVVTSLEFERILSASGPYQGHILRPSDRKEPKRIAWVQCVGSRDVTCGKDYCSSVCCMYATKEAVMAVDHVQGLEATVFYNDMRAFGKGFEGYFESAKDNYGVRFVRGIVSTVKEMQRSKNMKVRYLSEKEEVNEEEFDLVVLSVGLSPTEKTRVLAERLGIRLNAFGFCEAGDFSPNQTTRPGIFVAGTYEAPMDIPETVMGASSGAGLASELLCEARGSLVREKSYPPERDVEGEEPRIGVFICRCGTNIARVVGVSEVVDYARSLPGVVYAEENLYTCSTDTQEGIIGAIDEHRLNRVVVASCTPRTHEPLFQETLCEGGLNKYLFEMANIRDQCSWVHASFPEEATEKARDLVRMAAARAETLEPLRETSFQVNQKGLVVGGGLSGMTAALCLARQGFEVFLVERERELGGNLRGAYYTLTEEDIQSRLASVIEEVERHERIRVYKGAEILEFSGHVGKYTAKVKADGKEHDLEHGAVIVATGGAEYSPEEYSYGQSDRVLTQREFEEAIGKGVFPASKVRNVVMIQCVGSREEGYMYCCRVGCSEAIKNALRFKELNPEANIFVLFRDIRTYAFNELYYRKAREAGIVFVRYEADRKPQVRAENDGFSVRVFDEAMKAEIEVPADYLILTASIRPHPSNEDLSTVLKVPLNSDGFYLEAHMKLRPLDFVNEGMYLCGLAHGPKSLKECISQAQGAAARASTILSKEFLSVGGAIAVVDQDRCVACLTCVRECPFGAPAITEEKVAFIEPASCQGCGMCASACPRKAIELKHYKEDQILAKCKAIG